MIYMPFESVPRSGTLLEWNRDIDLAMIRLTERVEDGPILEPLRDQFRMGEWNQEGPQAYRGGPVCAIGYESPPWLSSGPPCPLVTWGEVCQVVGWGGEGVMMVTSAVVLPGMSGGVVVSGDDGRVLGLIVSISE